MANGKLCNRLLSNLTDANLIFSANESNITVRPAEVNDIAPVTSLIHRSFEVWAKEGLRLSPMFQTDTETSSHLSGKGFVATDENDKVVGTFSVDEGLLSPTGGELSYQEGHETTKFTIVPSKTEIKRGKYLVFKKLAVDPGVGRIGLGLYLYKNAEDMARASGYAGVVLETVQEARWLYEWYENLGFSVVGIHRYSGSQVDTLLMIKSF